MSSSPPEQPDADAVLSTTAVEPSTKASASLIGKRVGNYDLQARIGKGGMGEVYKARDSRLDRIVAIKILSPHLANDAQLRERFEREARTVARLNHPHICTLYDIGRQDGIDYLVMEYIEGETLAETLRRGRLPI
jgi:serine/threonine protein kinase